MSSNYLRGFVTLNEENPGTALPGCGKLPDWVNGTLIRNGPAFYDLAKYKLLHWLDGFAMLHKFEFRNGQVLYANRFLQTSAYTKAMKNGELAYREYASQPHGGWLSRLYQILFSKLSDNGNVNVVAMGNRFLAITDVPKATQFDPRTLDTIGAFRFDDDYKGILGPSHPQYDYKRKLTYSYFTSVNYSGGYEYNVYSVADDSITRKIVKTIKTKYPAYMHSFFMTDNYIILPVYPWVLKNVAAMIFKMRPAISDYSWIPNWGTTFLVINKDTGEMKSWQSEAFAAFHTINAFEKDGDIFLDVSAYPDTSLVNTLFFDWLIAPGGGEAPVGEFRRYHLRKNSSLACYETITASYEEKSEGSKGHLDKAPAEKVMIEMPRINYERSNGKPYRYAYGYNRYSKRPNDFYNHLIKVDLETNHVLGWQKEGHYPGEPVFVPKPQPPHGPALPEDDGIVLSVVLDTSRDNFNDDRSYLLVLDGQTFEEMARFYLPRSMPLGLHGMYFDYVSTYQETRPLKWVK